MKPTSEAAFETVIEAQLLGGGYVRLPGEGFDRERAVFPDAVFDFVRETQPREWARLEALHGPQTGEQVLTELCKWLGTESVGDAVAEKCQTGFDQPLLRRRARRLQ